MNQNCFVPWWQGFKFYWRWWKDDSYFYWRKDRFDRRVQCHPDRSWSGIEGRSFVMEAIGWSVVIRTPLAMIHIAKCSRSCTRDGYESGIRIHWFPKRWSLRLREAEVMYRHTRDWMSFIPKVAIRGLR
jgi:hypothetical protein